MRAMQLDDPGQPLRMARGRYHSQVAAKFA
jgi:hypothetical protein